MSDGATLVGISGIDASGKGYVASLLEAKLQSQFRTVVLHADDWLRPPAERFDPSRPAAHFYESAIRFDEMFARLVLPLRDRRSVHLEADYAEETAVEYRRHRYDFEDVDVIVLEGIYLLKRALRAHYDLAFWIECSFDTALARALARQQEGLSAEETITAYRTIYFPAQELHFARDEPWVAATAVVNNDAPEGGRS